MKSLYTRIIFAFFGVSLFVLVFTPAILTYLSGRPDYFFWMRVIIILGPVSVLGLFTIITGYLVVKPIQTVSRAVHKIAQGNYEVRLDNTRKDEIGDLISEFNQMTEQLQNTELLRKDFVASISHEFKTPITAILGFANELNAEDLSEEKRKEALQIIIRESERLSALSANILMLNNLENPYFHNELHEMDLSEQIRECIVLLQKSWESKNIEWNVEMEEASVYANPNLLKQVWINLLNNAIKFSPENSTIDVVLTFVQGKKQVCITNHHTQIDEQALPHIFDRFYKGDVSRSEAGNGLGLAIVNKIIEIHKGTIRAYNQVDAVTFEVLLD